MIFLLFAEKLPKNLKKMFVSLLYSYEVHVCNTYEKQTPRIYLYVVVLVF